MQSVYSNVLNSPAIITNAIRLGKKDSHTRLLKITVQSLDEKKAILHNKLKLKREENKDNVRKLFITPDLTSSKVKL